MGVFRVVLKQVYVSLDANTLILMHHDSAGAGLFSESAYFSHFFAFRETLVYS